MKDQFYANGELNDSKILEALNEALRSYASGALLEARETLSDIVKAIDKFDQKYSPYEEPKYQRLPKEKATIATVTVLNKLPEAKEMAELSKKVSAPAKDTIKNAMRSAILDELTEAAKDGKNFIIWGYDDWALSAQDLAGNNESLEQEVFEELMDELQCKGYGIESHIGSLKIWW